MGENEGVTPGSFKPEVTEYEIGPSSFQYWIRDRTLTGTTTTTSGQNGPCMGQIDPFDNYSYCFLRIIFNYLKSYNCVQTNDYYQIEIITWNYIMVRVFTNGPGDQNLILGRIIPKTQKMVLDTSLVNTQNYKVRIKAKMKQSRERSSTSSTPQCSSYYIISR